MSKNKQLRKKITENTQNNQNAFLARRGFAFIIDFIITNRLSLFVTGIVYGLMNNGNPCIFLCPFVADRFRFSTGLKVYSQHRLSCYC